MNDPLCGVLHPPFRRREGPGGPTEPCLRRRRLCIGHRPESCWSFSHPASSPSRSSTTTTPDRTAAVIFDHRAQASLSRHQPRPSNPSAAGADSGATPRIRARSSVTIEYLHPTGSKFGCRHDTGSAFTRRRQSPDSYATSERRAARWRIASRAFEPHQSSPAAAASRIGWSVQ